MNKQRLNAPVAVCLALLAGCVLALAYPGTDLWWCAPVAIALHLVALRGQRLRFAALLGLLTGFMFYLLHVQWTSLFLGPVPWLALCVLMGLWWLLGAVGISLAYARLPHRHGRLRSLGALPVAVASLWMFRELLSATVPYGGFAWGRLAQSQANSPLLELTSWLGFTGLGFVLVWFVAFAVETVLLPQRASAWQWAARVTGLAALAALLAVWPLWRTDSVSTVRILAVQGDTPGASYFIPSEPGEILLAHAEQTLASLAEAGEVDLVLWPEGSVDLSPLDNEQAAELLTEVSEAANAPLLVNFVTRTGDWDDPGTQYFNSQLVWRNGETGEQYDKAHPIPFGEYVPDRDLYEALAPELIGMIQREYTPGQRSNTLVIDGVSYGVFICYDIVDDALVRAATDQDAGVLLAPTNNADFGRSDESAQQLATAKLRAVQSGRALLQASTVGWSAAYLADGTALAALDWYAPGAYVVEVPVATGQTPASAFGGAIEVLAVGAGTVLVLTAPRTSRK